MNSSSVFRRALAGAAFVALVPFAALAQNTVSKSPPRLPPNVSETDQIPSGVDTGTPTTSQGVPLGTPIPSDASADRADQRTRSAAARAAARADPLTRTGVPLSPAAPFVSGAVIRDASRPAGPSPHPDASSRLSCGYNDDAAFRTAMSQCTGLTDRASRSSCVDRVMEARRETAAPAAPVALPGSGFVGSSASPQTAAGLDRNRQRRGCD